MVGGLAMASWLWTCGIRKVNINNDSYNTFFSLYSGQMGQIFWCILPLTMPKQNR